MNYIEIDGVKIKLTEEQVAELRKGLANVKLSDVEIGDTFNLGGYEFVVLEQFEDETAVILKELWKKNEVFGENNNYTGSNVDELCEEFEKELSRKYGAEVFEEHIVDLTSDDGLKDYGSVTRRVSLLTAEQYRKYVEILDRYKPDAWWWLATPHSTKTHGNDNWAKCVSPVGIINDDDYCSDYGGVRPFCILKSNIFVSK